MCLCEVIRKKYGNYFFAFLIRKQHGNFFMASLKSQKKEFVSGVGSGSIYGSQRYGSADPDPHQKVTDPQYR